MKKILFFFHFSFFPQFYGNNIDDYFRYPVESSSSNYGLTGVLELPNARFMEEASSYLGIFQVLFLMNILQ